MINQIRKNKKDIFLITTAIFMSLGAIYLIGPFGIGYAVYDDNYENNISIIEDELHVVQDNLVDELNKTEQLKQEIEVVSLDFSRCNLEKEIQVEKCKISSESEKKDYEEEIVSLKNEFQIDLIKEKDDYKDKIDEINDELNEVKEELNEEKENNLNLAKNLANSICCKERVDKTSIDSFAVVDGNLFCLTGAENKINCP